MCWPIFPMLNRVDCAHKEALTPVENFKAIMPVAIAPLYVPVPLRRCLWVPEIGIWPPCAVKIAIRVCVTISDLQHVRIHDEDLPPRGSRPRHGLVNGTETAEGMETLDRNDYSIATPNRI